MVPKGLMPFDELKAKYANISFEYFQSNIEGELVDALQKYGKRRMALFWIPVYTHTSAAIGDAVTSIDAPVIEVHISNVHAREDFGKYHVSAKAVGTIIGLDWQFISWRWIIL